MHSIHSLNIQLLKEKYLSTKTFISNRIYIYTQHYISSIRLPIFVLYVFSTRSLMDSWEYPGFLSGGGEGKENFLKHFKTRLYEICHVLLVRKKIEEGFKPCPSLPWIRPWMGYKINNIQIAQAT